MYVPGRVTSAARCLDPSVLLVVTRSQASQRPGVQVIIFSLSEMQPMTEAMVKNGDGEAEGPNVEAIITAISSFNGHIANATDIANAILFLASSDAAACTGINILVDSGMLTGVGGKVPFT